MTDQAPPTINRTARLAGALYLAMMPFSAFGVLYVPSVLQVPGDPAATAQNIIGAERLLRTGTVSHLIGQVIFIFLVLALYRLLKPVNKDRAVLMVVLALLGVPMAFINEVNHLAALQVLTGLETGTFTAAQIQAHATLFLEMRKSGIHVTQVFWGLWLLPLGSLVFRSGFLPKLLGILLMIGGLGYLLDATTQILVLGIPIVTQFTFVGELLLPLWLLIKGVNVTRWQQVALEPRPAQ